jgi:ferrous iron transport protein B
LPDGAPVELVDLSALCQPGSEGPHPHGEAVTRDVNFRRQAGERLPDALLIVADAFPNPSNQV